MNTCMYPRRDPTTACGYAHTERADDTTEEITMTTPEPVDPIPADDAPHAYMAVKRTFSPNADRPEWAYPAYAVPEWNHEQLDWFRRKGFDLIPIGPDGDTGTRAITEPAEAGELAEEVKELRATLAAIMAADPDLFDPTGGTDRGAAHETYGSAGHELREKFLAAIGVNVNDYDGVPDGE